MKEVPRKWRFSSWPSNSESRGIPFLILKVFLLRLVMGFKDDQLNAWKEAYGNQMITRLSSYFLCDSYLLIVLVFRSSFSYTYFIIVTAHLAAWNEEPLSVFSSSLSTFLHFVLLLYLFESFDYFVFPFSHKLHIFSCSFLNFLLVFWELSQRKAHDLLIWFYEERKITFWLKEGSDYGNTISE